MKKHIDTRPDSRDQRKKLSETEHELRESVEKYRNLIENTFDGVIIHKDRIIVYANRTAVRMFGCTDAADLLGLSIFDVVHPAYRDIVTIRSEGALESVQMPRHEQFLQRDGTMFDVEVVASPIIWEGSPAVQVAIRDITEQKRAQEAIAEALELNRAVLNNAPVGILIFRATGQCIAANEAASKILGGTIEQLTAQNFHTLASWKQNGLYELAEKTLEEHATSSVLTEITTTFGVHLWLNFILTSFMSGDEQHLLTIIDNYTEQKQTETALRESESRYRSLVETTDTGFVIVDTDGRVVDANQKYVQLSGHRELAEILGRSVVEWTAGYEKEKNQKAVEQCAKDGFIRNFEVDYSDSSGSITPIEVNATVVQYGNTPRILTLCRDISDRRQAEQALRESEMFYRTIFETTGSASVIIEKDTTIIYANEGFARMSGYAVTELEGKHRWTEFVVQEDLGRMQKYHHMRRETSGSVPSVYEFRFADRHGTVKYCICNVAIIPGTLRSIASLIDISDRVAAEQELQRKNQELKAAYEVLAANGEELQHNYNHLIRKEQELRSAKNYFEGIYEGSPDLIFVHRADGRIIDVNENVLTAFGLTTREEAVSADPEAFSGMGYTAEMAMAYIRTALDEGKADFDWVSRKKNGEEFPVEVRLRRITSLNEDGVTEPRVLAIARDITERRIAEKALEEARKKLGLLNTLIIQDIQSMIFALSAYLQLANSNQEKAKVRSYAEKEAFLIHRIVSLLNFAKDYQEMGIHPPRWQDVNQVFLFALSHLDSLKVSRDIRVGGLEVYADPLLEKAFFNLIENAFLHGRQVTEISLGAEEAKEGVLLVFRDNGVGIPEEEKTKIFERGYGKNTGLGLFLVREILSITGMTIRENGVEGQGARFEILIPKGAGRFRRTD